MPHHADAYDRAQSGAVTDVSAVRKRSKTPRLAASNSFTAGEIQVLDALLTAARGRGDVRQILRSREGLSVQRKVLAMKARLGEVRELRSAAGSAAESDTHTAEPVAGTHAEAR